MMMAVFTDGARSGERYAVGSAPITIGRSHSADLRFTEPEISGKHLRLEERDGQMLITQLGSGRTDIGGARLAVNEQRVLRSGEPVRFAGGNAFVVLPASEAAVFEGAPSPVEAAALQTSASPSTGAMPTRGTSGTVSTRGTSGTMSTRGTSGTMSTRGTSGTASTRGAAMTAPPTGGAAGDDSETFGETQAMGTLAYTPDIEAQLRKNATSAARRKFVLPALAFAAAAVAVCVLLFGGEEIENPIARTARTCQIADIGISRESGAEKDFGYWAPGPAQRYIRSDGGDGKQGFSQLNGKIGVKADVPIKVRMEWRQARENLGKSRAAAFQDWRESRPGFRMVGLPDEDKVVGHDSGVACSIAEFEQQEEDGSAWRGFALFVKHQDFEIALIKSVPQSEFGRARAVLSHATYFFVSSGSGFEREHWEPVPDAARGAKVGAFIAEAAEALSPAETNPEKFNNIASALRLALTLSLRDAPGGRESEDYKRALNLLGELRRRQRKTFGLIDIKIKKARAARDYQYADTLNEYLRRIFNDPDDYRYQNLRRND